MNSNNPQLSSCIVENKIVETLTNYSSTLYQKSHSTSEWTLGLKKALADLGESEGYSICTSGFGDEYASEWLYDLTWFKNDSEGRLAEIALAVESEWYTDLQSIRYDFEKLLQSRANTRLIIFQGYENSIISIMNELQCSIESFSHSQTGDKYILAGLNWDKGNFDFIHYRKV